MESPFLHELKRQASFFLGDKIRSARLALTDVTPIQLMTEEATNGDPSLPNTKTLSFISRAAFDIDEYCRIVEILHKKLAKFDRKQWRELYKALLLLENLLTHGPRSAEVEFQKDREVIEQMGALQFVDEKGFNWGVKVRKKSERILKLLERGPVLEEERERARKIARGIVGFGSFNVGWPSTDEDQVDAVSDRYERSNSHYEEYGRREDGDLASDKENLILETKAEVENGKMRKESRETEFISDDAKGMNLQSEDHPFSNFKQQSVESSLLLLSK